MTEKNLECGQEPKLWRCSLGFPCCTIALVSKAETTTVASPLIENGCVKWVQPLLNGKSSGPPLNRAQRVLFSCSLKRRRSTHLFAP